ncbi:hypothetical protein ACROYT_G023772 [Oculina patagonica]
MLPKLVSILFLLSLLIAVFCCTKGQEENSDIQGVDKRSSLVARECGKRLVWARYKLVCLKAKRSQRKLQARMKMFTEGDLYGQRAIQDAELQQEKKRLGAEDV